MNDNDIFKFINYSRMSREKALDFLSYFNNIDDAMNYYWINFILGVDVE